MKFFNKEITFTPERKLLYKKRTVSIIINAVRYFFLLALSYVVLFQLFFMISQALRPRTDLLNPSVVWIPTKLTFENFKGAFEKLEYLKTGFVSIWLMEVSAFIEVMVCAVIAYGFARFEFKEKNLVFFLVLVTIIVPTQMLIIPMYLNYAHFDILGVFKWFSDITGLPDFRPELLNTGLTFWLPSLFGVGVRSGLFIFIYRKFFEGLPRELEEAAYVDGAGPLRTFISVILPSSGVVFLTVTIFSTIWHWNESYMSDMYNKLNPPLAVKLDYVRNELQKDSRSTAMAACLLFVLPMLVMYMILQRKFVQSIDRVGIVG
ncbi:MAG: carbohydrate ABC transporter permease [Clostridia bacterium]|nr:carbohydrate ABC transporter permease [Clostridia bacterium]